jgi:putative ABC transport system permease protein
MKFLPLVWANLKRKKVRTGLTLLAIAASFFLYGLVQVLKTSLSAGVDVAGNDRLVTIHKVSLIQPLPVAYLARIARIPGVDAVTHANWFGGVYKEPKNFFPQMAVATESYLDLYPELILSEEEKRAWLADRTGAIVGRATAQRFGFEVGDRIPIQGTIYQRPDGGSWEFTVDGVYDGREKGTDTSALFFHYDYLEESLPPSWQGLVGWYVLRVADPARAGEVALAIDAAFANSPYETKTSTEKAFAKAFADQIGSIGAISAAIAGIVFFIMLLVAGNTMAQAVRERTNELAVLKTLGFGRGRVLGLVLAESFGLAIAGGALGVVPLLLLIPVLRGAPVVEQYLPVFYLPRGALLAGLGFILLLGLVTGLLPGWQAMRLRIVDALRRVP